VQVAVVILHAQREHARARLEVWPDPAEPSPLRIRGKEYGLTMTVPGLAGILLTGGASRRLGTDKSRLVADAATGETLAARARRLLEEVCGGPVLEAGDGLSGLPAVREQPRGAGPLAALAAAGAELRARGHHGPALLLAVDMPRVEAPILELLGAWPGAPTVVPRAGGHLQPVCARYGADALLAAGSLTVTGLRPFRDLLDVVEHDVIDEAVWGPCGGTDPFADVDTPSDATRLGIRLPPEG
jgi:molybdopterin-guanine dinucleotide biosynthesis protein A